MTQPGPRRARRGLPTTRVDPPRRATRSWWRWLLLPAGCLLLGAWAASCLVGVGGLGAVSSLVVALATFTPFLAVAAIPLVTLAVRRKRWVCAGIAVLAAAFPWWYALGYASPSDAPVAEGDSTVHLMIVDARQGQADAADVVAAATAGSVDLLVVTELSGTLAHELTLAGLDRLMQARSVTVPGVQGADGGAAQGSVGGAQQGPDAGLGVWSRLTVDGVRPVPGTQWPALSAQVASAAGPFTLITGHVAPPVPDGGVRWAQDLAALRAQAAAVRTGGGPVVLLGNLNATPWHADFRRFASVGLQDAADGLGRGLRPTWPTWSPIPLLPLDHALVGGGVGVVAIDTAVIGGTDHRALLVTLRIPRH